jgi:hypothetical protein
MLTASVTYKTFRRQFTGRRQVSISASSLIYVVTSLVTGGRDYSDSGCVYRYLTQLKPDVIVHGAATGADSLADAWAKHYDVPVKRYPADWHAHGRAAGPKRNQQMIDCEKPDVVLAFPGGKGTADLVRRAERAGIRVIRAASSGEIA